MAIDPEKYTHSKKYDIYFDLTTRLPYKRVHRSRKSEITEQELVPVKLYVMYDGYIHFTSKEGSSVGIYHAFADAEKFKSKVGRAKDHDADPDTFSELNHKSGIHDTYESNFPENLEWTSPRVNRAMTCRTRSLADMDEAERERVIKDRDRKRLRRMDPEYREKERADDRARKKRYREERKELRQQQSEELNEWVAKMDKPRLIALEVAKVASKLEKN